LDSAGAAKLRFAATKDPFAHLGKAFVSASLPPGPPYATIAAQSISQSGSLMSEPISRPARRRFPVQRFLLDARYAVLIIVASALMITAVKGDINYFPENLVASLCVGMIAFALIDGTRLMLWGAPGSGRPQQLLQLLAVIVVAVPVAQYAGIALAGWLLGVQIDPLASIRNGKFDIMVLFTLVCALGATLLFSNRERIALAEAAVAEEKARSERISRQALQAQLQLLQAQVEPHMLFNTLANLQGLIALDAQRAQTMLDQLILYLRATLLSSRARHTTLAQEFALMEAYLGLMSVRMGARLSFSLDLPAALRNTVVPPMLLQPLVENAIMHGIEPKIDGGHVSVRARAGGDTLQLCVSDTGLGLDAPSAKHGTHLGVANIRGRLAALYGDHAALALAPGATQGAQSRLTLPLAPA
jgi:signal transduction histidine kinase